MKKNLTYIFIFLGTILSFYLLDKMILLVQEKERENAIVFIQYKDDMTTGFNTDVKVSDFIEKINGTIIDDYSIDTTKIGIQTINFKYINEDNIKLEKSMVIEVKDITPPIVWLSDTYTVNVNYSHKLEDRIMCIDDYDDTPTYYIDGNYDLNKVGKYPLKFVASDSSGNTITKDFTLIVKKPSNSSAQSNTSYISYSTAYDKYKNDNTQLGIDVSTYQGEIDFEKVKNAGVEFAIIRVGSRANNEYFVDSQFKRNIEGFHKMNIPVGVYFYSYANSEKEVMADANFVLKTIKGYDIELPIFFDWENWSNYNVNKMSQYHLNEYANKFISIVSNVGYKGMLYGSKNYLEKIWYAEKQPVWLAHYASSTNYEGEYEFWQFAANGLVDGINGPVDLNVRYLKGDNKDE